jgi:hypothetical protein
LKSVIGTGSISRLKANSAVEHGNSGNLIKNTRADASVPVVIVASAFGAQAIRRDGHAAWAEIAAKAGAAGFEVRRELFSYKAQSQPASLYELGQRIRAAGIWPVYSTPASLFDDTGALDERAMEQTLDEAAALDARIVKFQLGGSESAGTVTDCEFQSAGRRRERPTASGRHNRCVLHFVRRAGKPFAHTLHDL